jgi:hypothetical protein
MKTEGEMKKSVPGTASPTTPPAPRLARISRLGHTLAWFKYETHGTFRRRRECVENYNRGMQLSKDCDELMSPTHVLAGVMMKTGKSLPTRSPDLLAGGRILLKHPVLAHQEICQGTQNDGDSVCDKIIQVAQVDHQFHQRQIARDRDSAGG